MEAAVFPVHRTVGNRWLAVLSRPLTDISLNRCYSDIYGVWARNGCCRVASKKRRLTPSKSEHVMPINRSYGKGSALKRSAVVGVVLLAAAVSMLALAFGLFAEANIFACGVICKPAEGAATSAFSIGELAVACGCLLALARRRRRALE
jgi:hypothetical protein